MDAGMGLDWACREAEAEVYLLEALAILDAGPALTPARTLDVLDALASVYEGLASDVRLEGVLARCEAFIAERFGRECLPWLWSRIDRARLMADGGRPGEALVLLDEVESAMEALFGEGVSFAYLYLVRARAARLAGDVARARAEIERALALGGDELCLFESGNISLEEGDPSGAAAHFRAILADLEVRDMMWGLFAVEVQRSLAMCLAAEDRPREAHALFEHAAGTLAKVRPAGHPSRVELDLELARIRLRLGPYR
jgi:tetratricopeptide (TPR) repeat protein